MISVTIGIKLFVLPVLIPQTLQPEKPKPQVEYLENVVVVWLDYSTRKPNDNQTSKSQLEQIVNSVQIFTKPEECQSFMSTIKDEKILVIMSGIVEEKFVSNVHDTKQLESIYILAPNKSKTGTWFKQYPEIRGVYSTMLSLCEQLSKDVKMIDRNFLGFEVIERSSSNNASKTSQQDALFMYDQLFQDIVLAVPNEKMQDLYEFCEQQYQRNDKEQEFLKTFKQNYSFHHPVWWYSQESFLYRMLNKALRTHQYDILYLLRIFIRDLHRDILAQQKKENITQIKLFRGQAMEKDDFDRLRTNEGGLLSISNFLSTSADREVGLRFARDALPDKRKVSVLMEITVDKNMVVPVANISSLSVYKTEQEWLFSMGSVFRIGTLKCLPEGIWVVSLTLTADQDEQLNDLREHFKKSMTDKNICLNFGSLMYKLAAWKKSEYFYLKALETEILSQRRAVLFNNLGLVKGELKQYNEALNYFFKSLEFKGTAASDSASDVATTYNNIAAIYHDQQKLDRAIEYYQKAIEVCNTPGNNDESLVAILQVNIGMILNDQGKYEEALEKYEESLKIRRKIFPAIHPSIANAYAAIANVMSNMGSHKKAIEYAEKAVDIDRQALPPDHPQMLLHISNLETYKQQ